MEQVMERFAWRLWTCLLWLCFLWTTAVAQAAVPEIPRFRVLGAADGLPSTTIPALVRDRAGYLWMATHDGLARYDGVSFRVWRHEPDDPTSLPGNIVQALHIDAQDRIWVATENGGLSLMGVERKGFRHFRQAEHPGMASDDVFTIASHGDTLWFGSFGGGLCAMSATGTISHFGASESEPRSLPSDDLLALTFDAKGELWIGTMAGLARYDGKTMHRVALPGEEAWPIVFFLTVDGERLWAGTSAGVFQRDAQGQWTAPAWSPMFARPNAVMAMVGSDDGKYWLGGQGGLWRTEGTGAPAPVSFDMQGFGATRTLQTLLRQPDGGVWVPVPSRGLGYLRADWRRVATLSPAEGLSPGLHRGIAAARAGGIWLTSIKGVIEHVDTLSGQITRLPWHAETLKNERLTSVLEDRRGRLWLGSGGKLARIDLSNHVLKQWTEESAEDALPRSGPVDWLLEAPNGDVWLSVLGGGLQRRDGDSGKVLEEVAAESGLTALDTEAIGIGPDGALWLAGAQGLLSWDPQRLRFAVLAGTGGERVYSFAFEDDGRLWLHRLSGLELWRRQATGWQREKRLTIAQGVPAVESTGLQLDGTGRPWLATRRGLFRVDPESESVRLFGVRDGLLSQEFTDRALLITADGVLIGSAADGTVMLLDTTLPDPAPVTPNLVLDSIQVGRDDQVVVLPGGGDFVLQADDHELQVSARLLSFEDPLANRYRSRLQGFDKDWVNQGASGERVFSALPAGQYVLRLQAFDAVGNASVERRVRFRVLPPWWLSGWGIGLFVLLGLTLLGVLAALYRRRLRRRSAWQLREHKQQLAEQASLAKTRFLATLGHEVRTPMTGVLGMSELLLGTALDQRQQGYANAIQNAGSHLLRLVNDALDIARIEAGKLELQQEDFNLRALIDEVVGMTAPMAERRGLALADDIADGTPAALCGDPVRVRQILLNLLGNAIKFTDRGGVSLHVSAASPQGVRLEISDTGPGLNEEQQARLFQRFEQAEGARTAARHGGSGLGLAICQEQALAMGGRIRVHSTPGVGTRFTVDLPLPTAVLVANTHASELRHATRPMRILLVEDDATVAEVITGLLGMRGHQVSHAAHGLAALTATASQQFDVALLDLDLPGLDGLALARQLRAQSFLAPLVAVTARADAEAETLAYDAGFNGFLRKPVTGDMLADAIAAVFAPQT